MAKAQFCTQCGARLMADARFCVECGLPASGARAERGARWALGRYAPAVVIGAVAVIGASVIAIAWLNPKTPPSVPPHQEAAPPVAGAQMPEGHPPVVIPEDVKQTITDMSKKAREQPENLDLWKHLAEVQYRAGQIDPTYLAQAEASFEHILEREKENTDVLRNLGNIAFDREQPAKAVDYYTRYLSQKPDDQNVQTDRATMFLAAGETDKAIEAYQGILAKDPAFFQAQFNLGLAYHRAGNAAESVAALQKARDLAQDDRGRAQVEGVLERMQGAAAAPAPAPPAPPPAAGAATLRTGLEGFFRGHQIMGPKLDRFEWVSDGELRVVLRDFPMQAMPDFVRTQLDERIRGKIKEQKAAHQITQTVEVKLVDAASGETMETVAE